MRTRDRGLSAELPEPARATWELLSVGPLPAQGSQRFSLVVALREQGSRRFGRLPSSARGLGKGAGAEPRGPHAPARKSARPAVAGRCVRVACAAAWAMGRRARGRRLQQQQQQEQQQRQQRPPRTEDGAEGGGKRQNAVGAGARAGRAPVRLPAAAAFGTARGCSSAPG